MTIGRRRIIALALFGWLTSCLVQTGSLSSADATRRLQVTRSLWTSEPQVKPSDFPEFGIVGRGNRIYAWYGIGQSLVMLPGDVIGMFIARHFMKDPSSQDRLAALIMCFLTFPLISAAIAVTAFSFLQLTGAFTALQSSLGAISLLLSTSLLYYLQVHQENDLLLLMTLLGLYQGVRWVKTAHARPLLLASVALGFGLLIRLPAVLNFLAVAAVVMLLLEHERSRDPASESRIRLRQVATIAIPTFAAFIILDRAYQVHRFGVANLFTNYIAIYAHQTVARHPELPKAFPLTTPFLQGFFGCFFAPDASIFLYDPLIVLTIYVAFAFRRSMPTVLNATVACFAGLAIVSAAAFARLDFWAGHSSWGDRYTSVPSQLLAMLAIPLASRAVASSSHLLIKNLPTSILTLAFIFQATSLVYPLSTEEAPALRRQTSAAIAFERPANILRSLLGHPPRAGDPAGNVLSASAPYQLLPFRTDSKLPRPLRRPVQCVWFAGLAGWACVLLDILSSRVERTSLALAHEPHDLSPARLL